MLMDFDDYKLAPDGSYMLNRPQALLLALTSNEETPSIMYFRQEVETLFAGFVTGQFREKAIPMLQGEQADVHKVRVRVFEAFLDGKLTLKDSTDTCWIPERPPTSKADAARWKLAGRDPEAARKIWSLLDTLTPRPITEAKR